MKFYTVMYKIFAPALRWFFNVRTHGRANIPDDGGLLVCPNHISASDVVMLSASTYPRQIRYMAKAELFKIPLIKQIIVGFGAFPIKRGEGDVGAIKKTISLLCEGDTVGVFPQGTRFRGVDIEQSSVKHGAGLIVYRSKVNVLPVAIRTKGNRVRPFKRVDIIYGKPIPYEAFNFTNGNRTELAAASELIFDEIKKLHKEDISKYDN